MAKIITLEYETDEEDAQVAVAEMLKRLYNGVEELHFAVLDESRPGEVEMITARGYYRVNVN